MNVGGGYVLKEHELDGMFLRLNYEPSNIHAIFN